jgi:hypothetical protein
VPPEEVDDWVGEEGLLEEVGEEGEFGGGGFADDGCDGTGGHVCDFQQEPS